MRTRGTVARTLHGTTARAFIALVLLVASAPGALAQENESGPQPPEGTDEGQNVPSANATDREGELVTEPSTMGDAPPGGEGADPAVVTQPPAAGAPEEAGAAQTFLFAGLWLVSALVLAMLALLGVAYAAFRRGGARR